MKIFQLIDLIIKLFKLNKRSKVVLLFLVPTVLCGQNQAFWLGKRTSGGAPTNLLLDDYPGAAAAYSVRKLDKDYTGFAMEIRRASDNATQNIGFVGENLDVTSINTFCSGTTCTVRTWYDQSGNGRNAVQATAANQPTIYTGGSVTLINGQPAVLWPNYTNGYSLVNNSFNFSQPNTIFTTIYFTGISGRQDYVYDSANSSFRHILLHLEATNNWTSFAGLLEPIEPNADLVARKILFCQLYNTTNSLIRKNGSQTDTGNAGTMSMSGITIGNGYAPSGGQFNHSGSIFEIIIYNSNKTTDISSIENNINTYYSIY